MVGEQGLGSGTGHHSQCVFFWADISPNFDLKILISTYSIWILNGKNGPLSPDFEKKRFQIAQIFMISSSR
jgi:hypothetical protein